MGYYYFYIFYIIISRHWTMSMHKVNVNNLKKLIFMFSVAHIMRDVNVDKISSYVFSFK